MNAMYFEYYNPTRIIFGRNSIDQSLANELKLLKLNKVAIITDKGIIENGALYGVESSLKKGEIEAPVFDGIQPNPTINNVEYGVAFCKDNGCEALLAVGGGSVMDAAKAIGAVLKYGGHIADYQGMDQIPGPITPLISIPTTAGTGSEVSFYSLISDPEQHFKLPIASQHIASDLAIIDPTITVTLPPFQTAITGMDALTHCVEAILSIKRDPISESIALAAIEKISKWLRPAVHTGDNMEAREQRALASTMAGMAVANPVVAGAHAVAHALGGLFDIPHGAGCAMALPFVLKYNFYACGDKPLKIAEALGVDTGGLTTRDVAERAIGEIIALSQDVGIPDSLEFFNIDKNEASNIVNNAMMDGAIAFNPREFDEDTLTAIVEALF